MSDTENLHFKIELLGTFWKKRPAYSIYINDTVIKYGTVEVDSGEVFIVEFDQEFSEGPQSLKIRLENKEDSDVLKDNYDDPDNYKIIGDMLLNIKNIEIDEISLDNLLYNKSLFTPDDPARPVLDKCLDLGWNGTWNLEFTSPFYIWLLENI
jgi:hypothetical protein